MFALAAGRSWDRLEEINFLWFWCLVAATNAKNFRDFPVLDLKTLVREFEWNATRELICIRHRADRPDVTSVDVDCPQWCQIMHATFYLVWLNIRVDRLRISRISLYFADVKYPHELINQSTFTFLSIVSKFKMILHCSRDAIERDVKINIISSMEHLQSSSAYWLVLFGRLLVFWTGALLEFVVYPEEELRAINS